MFHTPGPKARATQEAGAISSKLLETFPPVEASVKHPLNDAIRVVESRVFVPASGALGEAGTVYPSIDAFHQDFARLRELLAIEIPPPSQTPERTWSTMAVLLQEHVTADELPRLLAEARLRDVVRSLIHTQIVYWSGFGISGLVGLALGHQPPLDETAFIEPKAQELAKAINFTIGYVAQAMAIGLGEAGLSISAEGRLDMQYNKPAPVRDGVQWSSFASFAIGHGLVDSGMVTADMEPNTLLAGRIASGAVCSLAVGLHRALLPYLVTEMDPVWLDASKPAKAGAMRRYIDNLRQPRCDAIAGYFKDLGTGLKGGLGIPSLAAFTRWWYRSQTAAFVLCGRAVAFQRVSEHEKMIANVATDVFIGAAWGVGSTLPAKAAEGVKSALGAEEARRQPVRRDQVNDIVPASVLTRRKPAGQSAALYHE